MRALRLPALLALAMLLAPVLLSLAGCSGDDDDAPDVDCSGPIECGTWNVTVLPPVTTCTSASYTVADSYYADVTQAEVVVASETSFRIEYPELAFATNYDISGTSLLDPTSPGDGDEIDFTSTTVASDYGLSQTYDCVLIEEVIWDGEITGESAFTLRDSFGFRGEGTECAALVTSGIKAAIPCAYVEEIQLQR